MSAETMKMPEPIMLPATSMVASNGPSRRWKWPGASSAAAGGGAGAKLLGAAAEDRRQHRPVGGRRKKAGGLVEKGNQQPVGQPRRAARRDQPRRPLQRLVAPLQLRPLVERRRDGGLGVDGGVR